MKNIETSIVLFLILINSTVTAQIKFLDVSKIAGINGDIYSSSGGHGLGVNWVDINNDGWDDLFLVGGKPKITPKLFLNNANGTFSAAHHLLPKLEAVEMSGSRFADYDRDGDKDIFIYTDNTTFRVLDINEADGPKNIMLKNNLSESGILSFVNVAQEVGLEDLAPKPFGKLPAYRSKTASWLDFDRDGCIDLYVGHNVINLAGSAVNKDRLYRNNCKGSFIDFTTQSGMYKDNDVSTYRAALASGGFQINNDLWPDLYVVNVSGLDSQPLLNDFLYTNKGAVSSENWFEESKLQLANFGNDSQAGMGIDIADIDNDGDWDIYISDLLDTELDQAPFGNVLYLNQGKGVFSDNSAPDSGIQGLASWGVNFFDADHDGWEDLFVGTIFSVDDDILYKNNGINNSGITTFSKVPLAGGISVRNARGSATSDFDHDGDLDLAVISQNGELNLYRNETVNIGSWLIIKLKAQSSNLDAIGTVIKVKPNKTSQQMRQVKGGSSAHSQDSLNIHFGFGNTKIIDEIIVEWPSGKKTLLNNIIVNQYITIFEEQLIYKNSFEQIK